MNKKTIFFLIMLIMLSVTIQAEAGRKPWPNMIHNLRFGLYMAENNLFEARLLLRLKNEIGLTQEQGQKIENMMLSHEEAAIRSGSDIKVLELKFAALLKSNRIDRSEMGKMVGAIGKLKTDLQVDHLNYLLDVRDILTTEQIQKIEKIKKEIPRRIRDNFRGRQGDFPPPTPPDDKDETPDEA